MSRISDCIGRAVRKLLRCFPRKVEFSLGELMLQRGEPSHAQFVISALLMDVENYCDKNDASFHYQNVGRGLRGFNEAEIDASNDRFRRTIDSVVQNGYREDSLLQVGRDITLHDGTHRTAICLYLNHYALKGNAYCYKSPFFYRTADEFIQFMGFPQDYVNEVLDKYHQIQDSLIGNGLVYGCFSEKDPSTYLEKMAGLHLHSCRHVRPDQSGREGYYLQFTMDDPNYRIKGDRIVSRTCERLEKTLKANYPSTSFWVSKNCMEGKEMFDQLKPFC